jgi:CRP-like cAMP-binding protein
VSGSSSPRLLDALDETERRRVIAEARRRRFARNEVLFHEGDLGDSMHLVTQGHVAIRITTSLGDVATMRIVRPGEFFGELAVVSPQRRSATAVALDRVETIVISREQLHDLRVRQPQIEALITEALVIEVRRLATQVVELMYLPLDQRVWRRVLDLSDAFARDGTPTDDIPLTQRAIAELAGCTRSTANRVLREGENAKIVEIARGHLRILDRDAVARRAG